MNRVRQLKKSQAQACEEMNTAKEMQRVRRTRKRNPSRVWRDQPLPLQITRLLEEERFQEERWTTTHKHNKKPGTKWWTICTSSLDLATTSQKKSCPRRPLSSMSSISISSPVSSPDILDRTSPRKQLDCDSIEYELVNISFSSSENYRSFAKPLPRSWKPLPGVNRLPRKSPSPGPLVSLSPVRDFRRTPTPPRSP